MNKEHKITNEYTMKIYHGNSTWITIRCNNDIIYWAFLIKNQINNHFLIDEEYIKKYANEHANTKLFIPMELKQKINRYLRLMVFS